MSSFRKIKDTLEKNCRKWETTKIEGNEYRMCIFEEDEDINRFEVFWQLKQEIRESLMQFSGTNPHSQDTFRE